MSDPHEFSGSTQNSRYKKAGPWQWSRWNLGTLWPRNKTLHVRRIAYTREEFLRPQWLRILYWLKRLCRKPLMISAFCSAISLASHQGSANLMEGLTEAVHWFVALSHELGSISSSIEIETSGGLVSYFCSSMRFPNCSLIQIHG